MKRWKDEAGGVAEKKRRVGKWEWEWEWENVNNRDRKNSKTYRMREMNNSMSPLQQRCLLGNDRTQICAEIDRNRDDDDARCL